MKINLLNKKSTCEHVFFKYEDLFVPSADNKGTMEWINHLDKPMKAYESIKTYLYKYTLKETREMLCKIKNFERDIYFLPFDTQKQNSHLTFSSPKINDKFKFFTTILLFLQDYLKYVNEKLNKVVSKSDNFNTYANVDKNLVKVLDKICRILDETIYMKVNSDNNEITKEFFEAHIKIKDIIEDELYLTNNKKAFSQKSYEEFLEIEPVSEKLAK